MLKHCSIPILAYHHVLAENDQVDTEVLNSPFTISTEKFHEQMSWLASHGFKTIGMRDLSRTPMAGAENGEVYFEKRIILTFDDGWSDNYSQALPVLHEFGFSATFFVITSMINQKDYMSGEQLQKMHAAGMEIESHTHNHVPLELLSDGEIDWELKHSKKVLETCLNRSVGFISFPHGSYNKKIAKMAHGVGYMACATSNVGCLTRRSKLLELPRFMIRKDIDLEDFAKLSNCQPAYLLRLKLLSAAKNLLKNSVGLKNYMKLHKMLYRTKSQRFAVRKELK